MLEYFNTCVLVLYIYQTMQMFSSDHGSKIK